MVTAPVFAKLTSPDTATSVALLEPLPTKILALSKFSSLVNSIAAEAFTSALTIEPSTILVLLTVIPLGKAPLANLVRVIAAEEFISASTIESFTILAEFTELSAKCCRSILAST